MKQAAFQTVRRSKEQDAEPAKSEISRVMAAMGRKGGKIGGKRRLETMTKEQRIEAARKAAEKRWAKYRSRKVGLLKRKERIEGMNHF